MIHAASQGDEAAICCILKHYEGYIRRLATRCFYDAAGNLYYFVDEAVRGQLEIKLIESILKFDIIRIDKSPPASRRRRDYFPHRRRGFLFMSVHQPSNL